MYVCVCVCVGGWVCSFGEVVMRFLKHPQEVLPPGAVASLYRNGNAQGVQRLAATAVRDAETVLQAQILKSQ